MINGLYNNPQLILFNSETLTGCFPVKIRSKIKMSVLACSCLIKDRVYWRFQPGPLGKEKRSKTSGLEISIHT